MSPQVPILRHHLGLPGNELVQRDDSAPSTTPGTGKTSLSCYNPGYWGLAFFLKITQFRQANRWIEHRDIWANTGVGIGHAHTETERYIIQFRGVWMLILRDDAPKEIIMKLWPKEWMTISPVGEDRKKKVRKKKMFRLRERGYANSLPGKQDSQLKLLSSMQLFRLRHLYWFLRNLFIPKEIGAQ